MLDFQILSIMYCGDVVFWSWLCRILFASIICLLCGNYSATISVNIFMSLMLSPYFSLIQINLRLAYFAWYRSHGIHFSCCLVFKVCFINWSSTTLCFGTLFLHWSFLHCLYFNGNFNFLNFYLEPFCELWFLFMMIMHVFNTFV